MRPDDSTRALRAGFIGSVAILVILALAFNYRAIPFWPGTTTVVAEFADASGLNSGDAVHVAGVEAGKVTSISLEDDHVDVSMRLTDGWKELGSLTRASIKVETALGRRYVELITSGAGELGDRIPLGRTTSGFDLTESLDQLTSTVADTDKKQVVDAVKSLDKVVAGLPSDLGGSLNDIADAARTVSTRDSGIRTLLQHTGSLSGVLAERKSNLTRLIGDGDVLFQALNDRAEVIRRLLVGLRGMSNELERVVVDNRASTPPMLDELRRITATLNANYANLDKSITGMKPYVMQFTDVLGSGPFFAVLLENITPANLRGQQPGSPGGGR
ncbi:MULTISPECIES: MCE family protein [Gordonia]|jgi:phospholipid/cholesterol/gamma-HCH transport system substrate-binding protein|uniref:MCE family protein n=1 Tax=Gordonia TaxID=2053 RepID=UPI0030FE28D9